MSGARVLATWERARRRGRGGRKVGSPDVSAGRAAAAAEPGGGRERGRARAAGARSLRPAPAPAGHPGARGMDSAAAAAAFALDKPPLGPGPPPPPPALGPGDCAQARKNFTVSHLLDLEEVAAAGRRAARPAPRAEAQEGAAREPSGGSSGSEAAPQDGERGGRGRAGAAGAARAREAVGTECGVAAGAGGRRPRGARPGGRRARGARVGQGGCGAPAAGSGPGKGSAAPAETLRQDLGGAGAGRRRPCAWLAPQPRLSAVGCCGDQSCPRGRPPSFAQSHFKS